MSGVYDDGAHGQQYADQQQEYSDTQYGGDTAGQGQQFEQQQYQPEPQGQTAAHVLPGQTGPSKPKLPHAAVGWRLEASSHD